MDEHKTKHETMDEHKTDEKQKASLSSLKKDYSGRSLNDHDHVDTFWLKHPRVRNETIMYIPQLIKSWFTGVRRSPQATEATK